MTALRLFEIANQLQSLEAIADSDELPAEVIRDTIEGLQGTFEDKAVQVAKFILSMQANGDAVKEAAKAMGERASRIEKRADSLKAYLLFYLQATQTKKIETSEIVLRVQKNPPSVIITDEAAIPDKYKVEPEPPPKKIDKKSIKAAIDLGIRVDGAYVESGEHLRISV
jgi:hypothetical protein